MQPSLTYRCFFWGKSTLTFGPYWNLCEGDVAEYIRFDRNGSDDENGPYNTIFRCRADRFKVSTHNGFLDQYKQNVVSSNTDWKQNEGKIEDHGYERYWINDNWASTPTDSCSYYLENRPPFFDFHTPHLFDWPFVPNNNALIPAQFRFERNNGLHQNEPEISEVLFAGWDIYLNVCGPPNINLHSQSPINNTSKEYIAMHNINVYDYELGNNNNISLKCEGRIELNNGFKINAANNNSFYAVVGDICDNKSSKSDSNNTYVEPVYHLIKPDLPIDNSGEIFLTEKLTDINNSTIDYSNDSFNIGPNPNNGQFIVFLPKFVSSVDINIYNISGKPIFFTHSHNQNEVIIDISTNPKGIYILKLIYNEDVFYKKIAYNI